MTTSLRRAVALTLVLCSGLSIADDDESGEPGIIEGFGKDAGPSLSLRVP